MSTPPGDQPPHDPNQPPGGYTGGYGNYPPPPPGYPQPGMPGQPQESNGLAVASLVLGIIGLVGVLCCVVIGVLSPAAIVLGRMGMRRSDASQGRVGGRGMAKAGFILGIIGTVLFVLAGAYVAYAVATGDFSYQFDSNL